MNDSQNMLDEQIRDVCCELSCDQKEAMAFMHLELMKELIYHLKGIEFNLRRFAK